MAALLPMSVAPRPPEVRPPRCWLGSMSTTVLPIRAACTAGGDAAGRAAVDDDVELLRRGVDRRREQGSDQDENDVHGCPPRRAAEPTSGEATPATGFRVGCFQFDGNEQITRQAQGQGRQRMPTSSRCIQRSILSRFFRRTGRYATA